MDDDGWLAAFHRGDRAVLTQVYEDYLPTAVWAVRGIVRGVDEETVVHDVFCALLAKESTRRNFQGGNLGAWLITIARRQAIDYRRRTAREDLSDEVAPPEAAAGGAVADTEEALEFRLLVARFRERVLPAKWEPVFQARFLDQLDQRAAARRLGMHRTTLAYQELRIRGLLRRFVLEGDQ